MLQVLLFFGGPVCGVDATGERMEGSQQVGGIGWKGGECKGGWGGPRGVGGGQGNGREPEVTGIVRRCERHTGGGGGGSSFF